MKIFEGESILEFTERFSSDDICKSYLSELKWDTGYVCKKCGNVIFTQRKGYIKTCTLCKHNESATANTVFHKVKFGLKKAFHITFEMVNSTQSLSAMQVANAMLSQERQHGYSCIKYGKY